MASNAQQTVIGIFDGRGLADKAVEDLQNAGFRGDQIYYSDPDEDDESDHDTDFWYGIKSLFAHDKTVPHDALTTELRDLGLSDDEILNYDNEYHIGRVIVAVKAPGREEEALAILRTNGAHN